MAELVAVVAERQRLRQVVGQRLEAAEVAFPVHVGEVAEAHPFSVALVPEAQGVARETGGGHLVPQLPRAGGRGEGEDAGGGLVGGHRRRSKSGAWPEAAARCWMHVRIAEFVIYTTVS